MPELKRSAKLFMLRFLIACFVLLSVSSAAEQPAGLVGKWSFAYKMAGDGDVSSIGVTVYRADGTYYSGMVLSSDQSEVARSLAVAISGRWKLEGKNLTMSLEETNRPELIPVGHTQSCEILEITDTHYRFRMPDGVERQESRIKL